MKKTHILGLIVIAAAVGILISMAGDFGTYGDFATAAAAPERNHPIVGHLVTDKPVEYRPEIDPNSFSFYMKDNKGEVRKVICLREKPQEFERSEQIVLTGKMEGEVFKAHDIQLKCPSKYQDEAIQNKRQAGM